MSRIVIYLDQATCLDTEDVTGADEFYIVGAVKTSDGQTSAGFVTQPISINDGQTMKFGPGGGYVFDGLLPDGGLFQVEMIALDEDTARDVSQYAQAKNMIEKSLASVPNPMVSTVGSLTLDAVETVMLLDKDDQLGTLAKPFSVNQLPSGWSLHTWNFQEDGIGWSTWKYQITYWVGKF